MLTEDILDLVNDGQWHDISEITEAFNQQEKTINLILRFYETFGFIEFNKTKNKIIINPKIQELFI